MKRKKLLLFTLGLLICIAGYAAVWLAIERNLLPGWRNQGTNSDAHIADWVVISTGVTSRLLYLEPTVGILYFVDNDAVGTFTVTTNQRAKLFALPEQGSEATGIAAAHNTVAITYPQQIAFFTNDGQRKALYSISGSVRSVHVVDGYFAAVVHTPKGTILYFYAATTHQPTHAVTLPEIVELTQLFVVQDTLYLAAQSYYPETESRSMTIKLPWSKVNQTIIKAQIQTTSGIFAWHNLALHEVVPTSTGSQVVLAKQRMLETEQSTVLFGTNRYYLYVPTAQKLGQVSAGKLENLGTFEPDTQYCSAPTELSSLRKTGLPCWQSNGEVYVYLW